METIFNSFVLTFFTLNLFMSFQVHAVPYDYSYVLGCVPKPEAPQYKGGIAVNPEFNEELKGWTGAGLASAKSPDGNSYAVVPNTVLSQSFNAEKEKLYTVSAWFQVSKGEAAVQVKVVTSTGDQTANWITAKAGCWTMLKGGFHVNVTEPAQLQFEANATGLDIWVDSVSLQPFTQEEWNSHQIESVEKVRKARVIFEVTNTLGKPVADVAVSIKQKEPHFPFGCAMNELIVQNQEYQKWFLEKGFKYSTFENELKWQFTEGEQGVENYSVPDAMLEFAKKNQITVRGHNILWDEPKSLTTWQKNLSAEELREAALKRVNSVVNKYKGQFIHWDVINENMHYNVFSSLTNNGSDVFKLLQHLDPLPIPFLNEFNVIEKCNIKSSANTWNYLQKIEQMRKSGYQGPLGIGLESHFDDEPNYPYIRACIDMLHATTFPIWVTELDVASDKKPWMLQYLDPLLRELHSHPYVTGIIVWGAVSPNLQCFRMCYTDNHYKNKPPGNLIDTFMKQFIRVADTNGKTNATGLFEASLFHGEYEATVNLPNGAQPPAPQTFHLIPGAGGGDTAIKFIAADF